LKSVSADPVAAVSVEDHGEVWPYGKNANVGIIKWPRHYTESLADSIAISRLLRAAGSNRLPALRLLGDSWIASRRHTRSVPARVLATRQSGLLRATPAG